MGVTNDAVNLILRGEPFRNFCHSFYDEFVEQNVAFRHRAGVKSLIIRRNLGGCCDWCQNLAGIYVYGEEPKDVYRRHDSCRCLVTSKFEGKGYQDVWSKKEFRTQIEARQDLIIQAERKKLIRETERINKIKKAEKEIDSTIKKKYNISPVEELYEIYKEDVAKGWISPLQRFEDYYKAYKRIEREIIGKKTRGGIIIREQGRHFLQRILGTEADPEKLIRKGQIHFRKGVTIDDVKEALLQGEEIKRVTSSEGASVTLEGKKCLVTINSETGKLIQCNPKKKEAKNGKKKNRRKILFYSEGD